MKKLIYLVFGFVLFSCSSDDLVLQDDFSEIDISGLYVGGNLVDEVTNLNKAVFWHEDQIMELQNPLDESWLNDLLVYDGNIYAIGTIHDDNESHGVLWVNNQIVYLYSNSADSRLYDIFVNDSGWFVAGREHHRVEGKSILVPTIWSSEGKMILTSKSDFSEATEILENNGQLYFIGTDLHGFEVVGGDFVFWEMDGSQRVFGSANGQFWNCCGYFENNELNMYGSGLVQGKYKISQISSNGVQSFDVPDNGEVLVQDLAIVNNEVRIVGTLPSFFSDHSDNRGFFFEENQFVFFPNEPSGCNSIELNDKLSFYGGYSTNEGIQKATLWVYRNGSSELMGEKFLWDNGYIKSVVFSL